MIFWRSSCYNWLLQDWASSQESSPPITVIAPLCQPSLFSCCSRMLEFSLLSTSDNVYQSVSSSTSRTQLLLSCRPLREGEACCHTQRKGGAGSKEGFLLLFPFQHWYTNTMPVYTTQEYLAFHFVLEE